MAYTHGANTLILDLGADFEPVGASPAGGAELTRYFDSDRLGNFIPATNQLRNEIERVVMRYRAILPAGARVSVVLGGNGALLNSYIATRVSVRQSNTGDASVDISFHKHANNEDQHATQEFTVTIPKSGYGVTANPITDADPASPVPADNCIAMEWTAEIGHVDKQDRLGDHLWGFSHGCIITCTQTYVDDEAAIAAAPGWFIESDVPSDDQGDARSRVVRGYTFVGPDA